MTLEEYDALMNEAAALRFEARRFDLEADLVESRAELAVGLQHHSRDPGFKCWTHKNLSGYYGTPREVVVALNQPASPPEAP